MAQAIPTIEELCGELMGIVSSVAAFKDNSYSIFSIDDFENTVTDDRVPLPAAGVGYDGARPINKDGTAADGSNSVSMGEIQFLVIVAIQYQHAGQDDTKPAATNLLDQIRQKVLGYRGVNSRPWRWISEGPEPNASGDGLAFYSQVWRTTVPVKGVFNNQQ